jgi:voltage-gated potassium channel
MEFRMQEVEVPDRSPLAERSLRELDLRQQAGVLVLALRDAAGTFRSNPDPDTTIHAGDVVIAVGTESDLQRLVRLAGGR